jgi:predicted metal-dependent phosphoesterase TrpH
MAQDSKGGATYLFDSQWSRADLHIHTIHSDGADDVRSILEHVASHTSLRVIAITDHDSMAGALEARAYAPAYGLEVVVGQEVSTRQGHVLGLYLKQPIPARLSILETVVRIHAQGGLAVIPHPLDHLSNSPMRHWPHPTTEDWLSYNIDALEILNGAQLGPGASARTAQLGAVLHVGLTGGSDAHRKEAIGVAYTLFPGSSAADLRRAIERKTCRADGRRWNMTEYWGWATRAWARRLAQPSWQPTVS